ncbi:aspartyl-phosphate phosphatase Spo0E family protein [Peribacillus sp. NPDC097295]|uniref:aspartyl-phosphate phosphatase Spo0E family protein n=1 Tax=Peribacillus sp. NPDC097295 TaxID=3364402 RepID=UPI0038048B3A
MCEIKLYRELELKIKHLRNILIETGVQKGLNHKETLTCSQRLDQLILKQFQITKQ